MSIDRLGLHPARGTVESAYEEVQVALRYSTIVLQDGPVGEVGENGDQIDDLLAYVIERLREFNQPPHDNPHTLLAIAHCEEAQQWLAVRTAERTQRGVEGTSQP